MYRELIEYDTQEEYRLHFHENYCKDGILTHDSVKVSFRESVFDHAFFASKNRRIKDKSVFSIERAKRIGWIKAVLQDESLTLYDGWISSEKRYDPTRRVCIVTPDKYVVVLRLISDKKAIFVTAYLADSDEVVRKIQKSPRKVI